MDGEQEDGTGGTMSGTGNLVLGTQLGLLRAYGAPVKERDGAVAAAGVVLCEVARECVARMQDVKTLEAHRRRGLASALIATCHAWAQQRGATRAVIVADGVGGALGRYERLGFERAADALVTFAGRPQARGA